MDLQYLRDLLTIFKESDADKLSIEEEGVSISISRHKPEQHVVYAGSVAPSVAAPAPPPAPVKSAEIPKSSEAAPAAPVQETKPTHQVLSPIVGTFYRSPAPDQAAYVQVGDRVAKGQTLCIVEAMKLMNEIESDVSGVIVKVLVENAKPVEYNQPLFLISEE